VDDDQGWQRLLAEILSDAGLEVHTAATLTEAEERLSAVAYRVAVVDLSLHPSDHRDEGGLAVLEAIAERAPGCQAILVTGYATVDVAVAVIREGRALDVLQKENFSRAAFAEVLDRSLAAPPPLADQPPTGPGGRSALVVDDDAGWRAILTELLSDAGYTVHPCAGFGEALGLLGRVSLHAAVVDLSLAGEGQQGLRLLAHTREAQIPTVVVSGVASTTEIEHIYAEHGVFAHIEKQSFERAAFLRVLEALREQALTHSGIAELTPRELETLRLLAEGLTNKAIAEALTISPNTVKRHLKAIFTKLNVTTRTAAAAKALEAGL
jgi:DNA-binding NarL/FixJ family response regulator